MRRTSLLTIIIVSLISVALISCGGYVKKDELEKQLTDQKTDLEQKVQLAQDSAATANDKAERALSATKALDKMKAEILTTVDSKIDSAIVSQKGDSDKIVEEYKRLAQESADRALAAANAAAISEDEKVKQMAKDAADRAMNAAMEADRRAQEAARQAEIAKQLPKASGEATVFTVYFDPGKIAIKKDSIAELEKAADAIKSASGVVKIEGHADNTPVVYSKYRSNWNLSQARANAVKDYLTSKLGVSSSSIKSCIGFADYKPNAPNDKKDKWQNRRVEIIITQ